MQKKAQFDFVNSNRYDIIAKILATYDINGGYDWIGKNIKQQPPTDEEIETARAIPEVMEHYPRMLEQIKPTESSEQPAKPEKENSRNSGKEKTANEKTLGNDYNPTDGVNDSFSNDDTHIEPEQEPQNSDLKSNVDSNAPTAPEKHVKTAVKEPVLVFEQYEELIKSKTDKELDIFVDSFLSKKNYLTNIELAKLPQIIKKRYKELGRNMPINVIRRGIIQRVTTVSTDTAPEWYKEYVYITKINTYINVFSGVIYSNQAFNIVNARYIDGDAGFKPSATKYLADEGLLQTINDLDYLPQKPYGITNDNGRVVFNEFKGLPKADPEYTTAGIEAIGKVTNHFKILFGDNYNLIMQYIAHCRQYPGIKLNYFIIIQSIPGTGKSNIIGEMIKNLLGHENTTEMTPQNLLSDFNSLLKNKMFVIFEELKAAGELRSRIVEKVKPIITNTKININTKGLPEYTQNNCLNGFVFTNDPNPLPLDKDDRRYCPIKIPFTDIKELESRVNMPKGQYFAMLVDALSNNKGQLNKYFDKYPITEEFKTIRVAPMTLDKEQMIIDENDSIYGLIEARDLINDDNNVYYNKTYVVFNKLFEEVSKQHGINLNEHQRNKVITKLNYKRFNSRFSIQNKQLYFYTNNRDHDAVAIKEKISKFG